MRRPPRRCRRHIRRRSIWRSPTGRKPAAVTSVPVSIGNAVDVQAKVAALHAVPALLHLHHHHLDGDDGVVDQQAERDDQRAERDAVQVDAGIAYMTTKTMASTSGTESATTMPVRQPSDRKLTTSTIASASTKVRRNSDTDVVDDMRLVGDLRDARCPDRQLGHDRVHRRSQVVAEREDVGALLPWTRRGRARALPAGAPGRSAGPR